MKRSTTGGPDSGLIDHKGGLAGQGGRLHDLADFGHNHRIRQATDSLKVPHVVCIAYVLKHGYGRVIV